MPCFSIHSSRETMKLHGKQLVLQGHKRIKLVRGTDSFELLLSPLPPAWNERMRALGMYDWPQPPRRPLMHKDRPVINPKSGRVEVVEDENDENYRKKFSELSRRNQMLRLAAHLKNDANVQMDTQEPTSNNKEEWLAYADALKNEFCHPEHGFTDNEISEILDAADKLESVLDLDAAVEDFLPMT